MKVKDLTGKQVKELLEYLIVHETFFDYTVSELWNEEIDQLLYFNRTPQGHKYWSDIVDNFNNK